MAAINVAAVAAVAVVARVHARGWPSRSSQDPPQRERDRYGPPAVRGAEKAISINFKSFSRRERPRGAPISDLHLNSSRCKWGHNRSANPW